MCSCFIDSNPCLCFCRSFLKWKKSLFLCYFYFILFYLLFVFFFFNIHKCRVSSHAFECVCFRLYTRISITCTMYTSRTWRKNVSYVFKLGFKCFTNASRWTITSVVPFSVPIGLLCAQWIFSLCFSYPIGFELNHSVLLSFISIKKPNVFEIQSKKKNTRRTKNNNNNNEEKKRTHKEEAAFLGYLMHHRQSKKMNHEKITV